MKGEKEPGIRDTPFVSNNKAVFQLSMWSWAKVQGLAHACVVGTACSKAL
jgi:hypothetical protein